MTIAELTKLGRGALIELDRKVGEPVDFFSTTDLWRAPKSWWSMINSAST